MPVARSSRGMYPFCSLPRLRGGLRGGLLRLHHFVHWQEGYWVGKVQQTVDLFTNTYVKCKEDGKKTPYYDLALVASWEQVQV